MERTSLRELMLLGAKSGGGNQSRFASGTFTVPNSATYTIDFGITFENYLFYIEMTDSSMAELMGTGIASVRVFGYTGKYQKPAIGSVVVDDNILCSRVKPFTGETSAAALGSQWTFSGSSITGLASSVTSSSTTFFVGYSYNYFVVEIK